MSDVPNKFVPFQLLIYIYIYVDIDLHDYNVVYVWKIRYQTV